MMEPIQTTLHQKLRAAMPGALLLFCFMIPVAAQDVNLSDQNIPLVGDSAEIPEFDPSAEIFASEDEAAPAEKVGLPTNVIEIFLSLGYWILPFGLATLIAIWFTTERVVVLRRGRVIPKPFVQRFLKLLEEGELEKDEALQICEDNGSPVAHVFAHGVRKWGKPSVEVEQAIIDGGERQVSSLRRHLQVINGVATVTPLIGLLGTVWGMLKSFNQIALAGAMGKTEQLASGIALALVTTAAGLIVAIPSLIAYMYLSGRVDALVMKMDELAQKVVHNISIEALSDRQQRPRTISSASKGSQKSAG
ncbi:MotA/TolQ/ExbB proton channel family protein [Thalassoglobus polymorphus]|uniref:Biopolymer transport protein ExbB n=1 Tax=Thalassoglobus polymorphus TaxID=2527994 RepID=A0A517QNG8_9PLAN|nr:MotA/TolQ/ExbB proton channel family protein [Thalassoglobus polymorphus]QDT33180.1 Biopolymer transport protein ExbB [Thalassoglobus polymorphus]